MVDGSYGQTKILHRWRKPDEQRRPYSSPEGREDSTLERPANSGLVRGARSAAGRGCLGRANAVPLVFRPVSMRIQRCVGRRGSRVNTLRRINGAAPGEISPRRDCARSGGSQEGIHRCRWSVQIGLGGELHLEGCPKVRNVGGLGVEIRLAFRLVDSRGRVVTRSAPRGSSGQSTSSSSSLCNSEMVRSLFLVAYSGISSSKFGSKVAGDSNGNNKVSRGVFGTKSFPHGLEWSVWINLGVLWG